MSTHDDILNTLYTQRQEILKQLADVDTKIKMFEAQEQDRFSINFSNIYNSSNTSNHNGTISENVNGIDNSEATNDNNLNNTKHSSDNNGNSKISIEHGSSGQPETADIIRVIEECMREAAGLRHALKIVGCLKDLHENPQHTDKFVQKVHYRNVFVHESVAHVRELAHDGNGSEFFQTLLSVFINGTQAATLHNIDYNPILRNNCVITNSHQLLSVSSNNNNSNNSNNSSSESNTSEHNTTMIISNSNSNNTYNNNEASLSEILMLINYLGRDYIMVSCNTNGARVAQKLIDCLSTLEEFALFTQTITESVVELAKDINGSHSIAKLMTSVRFKRLSQDSEDAERQRTVHEIYRRVYEPVAKQCIDICKNRQGCCIVQKCLQWAPEPYHKSIMDTVLQNTLKLVQDPFGNYVVQFILDRQQEANNQKSDNVEGAVYTNKIITQLLHHVADLSCNKFSSNVIEKCLKTSQPHVRKLLVDELTDPKELPKLLTDSFANYVIQTAISTASDDVQFIQLRDAIMPLQNLLKNSPYGVKIETKLARRHRESARRLGKKKDNSTSSSFTVHQSHVAENVTPFNFLSTQSQIQQQQQQQQQQQLQHQLELLPTMSGSNGMSVPYSTNVTQLQMFATDKMLSDFSSALQQQQQQSSIIPSIPPPPHTTTTATTLPSLPPPPPPPLPPSLPPPSFQSATSTGPATFYSLSSSSLSNQQDTFINGSPTFTTTATSALPASITNSNTNVNAHTVPSTPSETTYLTPSISTFNLTNMPAEITPLFTSSQMLGPTSFMLPNGQTMISIPQAQPSLPQPQQQQPQQQQQQQHISPSLLPSSSVSTLSATNTLVNSPIPSTANTASTSTITNANTATGNFLMNVINNNNNNINAATVGQNYWCMPVTR